MQKLFTKQWWLAAGTRAIKTFAQSFISIVGTSAVILSDVNWKVVVSAACLASILSLATSLTGLPEVKEDGNDG